MINSKRQAEVLGDLGRVSGHPEVTRAQAYIREQGEEITSLRKQAAEREAQAASLRSAAEGLTFRHVDLDGRPDDDYLDVYLSVGKVRDLRKALDTTAGEAPLDRLKALMERHGWAGTTPENIATIEQITRRAERVTALESQVAQLTRQRDNCMESWRELDERRRRLGQALEAHNTVQAGDVGPGYKIWIPDEDNHIDTLSCPVVIDANHLRELLGRHVRMGMDIFMRQAEAMLKPKAGETEGGEVKS